MPEVTKEHWHLDKKVPLALISMFVIQTVTFIVFATIWKVETDGRITIIERTIAKTDGQEARLIVVEQVALKISEDLREIKTILREDRRTFENGLEK